MICPACQQEVGDTGLGTPLPHHLKSGEEFCPGYVKGVPKYETPGVMPVPAPGRKVRSDKGTKRGQRERGGDALASTEHSGPALQAAPGGPAEPGLANELAESPEPRSNLARTGLARASIFPKTRKGRRLDSQEPERVAAKPRSNQTVFVVVRTEASEEFADYEKAAAVADKLAEEYPCTVYQGRTISRHEKGIKVTRLGRVRRGRP